MKTMQYELPPDATPELAEILKHHCRLRFVDGLWRCNSIDSYTLLKQSINNTFSKYCDRRVLCVTKDASRQFQFPCKIFKDIAARRLRCSPAELEEVFQTHLQELNAVLCWVEAQKVDMTWPSYQQFVRENIEYAFSHYKDPEVLNAEHPSTTAPPSLYSYLTTSNYAVKYIGKPSEKICCTCNRRQSGGATGGQSMCCAPNAVTDMFNLVSAAALFAEKPYSGKAFVRNAGSFLISHNEAGKTNIVRSVIRKCGNLPLQLPSGNTGMHNVISNKKKQFRKPSTFTSLFEHKCDSF